VGERSADQQAEHAPEPYRGPYPLSRRTQRPIGGYASCVTFLLLALLGCGLDFGNSSVITDVQVIAMVVDPPEAFPDEQVEITLTVADPLGRDLEAMIWMCMPVNGSCVESALPVRTWARVTEVLDEQATVVFTGTDLELDGVDLDRDEVTTVLHALVCAPDLCPIFDVVRSSGVEPDPALGEALADPESLAREIPFDGTHYAAKSLRILLRDAEGDRNWNPKANPRFTRLASIGAGDIVDLEFKITDANGDPATGYGYTTVGQFESPKVAVSQSELTMRWLGPEDEADVQDGRIYVVVEDNDGGVMVWSEDLLAR
jgi:hypothetical protein